MSLFSHAAPSPSEYTKQCISLRDYVFSTCRDRSKIFESKNWFLYLDFSDSPTSPNMTLAFEKSMFRRDHHAIPLDPLDIAYDFPLPDKPYGAYAYLGEFRVNDPDLGRVFILKEPRDAADALVYYGDGKAPQLVPLNARTFPPSVRLAAQKHYNGAVKDYFDRVQTPISHKNALDGTLRLAPDILSEDATERQKQSDQLTRESALREKIGTVSEQVVSNVLTMPLIKEYLDRFDLGLSYKITALYAHEESFDASVEFFLYSREQNNIIFTRVVHRILDMSADVQAKALHTVLVEFFTRLEPRFGAYQKATQLEEDFNRERGTRRDFYRSQTQFYKG